MNDTLPQDSPKLDIRDIKKSIGSLEVLKGVSLKSYNRDVNSIFGPSGSGKSTFLRCFDFLESPIRGEIFVDGEEVRVTRDSHGTIQHNDRKQITRIRAEGTADGAFGYPAGFSQRWGEFIFRTLN